MNERENRTEEEDDSNAGDEETHTVFSNLTFFTGAVVVAGFIAVCMLVVPRFRTVFSDIGMELPLLTELLLETSMFLTGGGWTIAAPAGLLVVGVLTYAARRSEGGLAFVMLLFIVLAVAAMGLIIMGLFFPLVEVVKELESSSSVTQSLLA